jgi:hypothetical protein
MQKMQPGNTLIEQTNFNVRLQPTVIRLGTSTSSSKQLQTQYGYGTSDNKGDVQSQTLARPKGVLVLTQTYTYDQINRLKKVAETGGTSIWSEDFDYDRFGNMWVTSPVGISLSAYTPTSIGDISQINNRLAMTNMMYDRVGNLKTGRLSRSFKYDAENRLYDFENTKTTYG